LVIYADDPSFGVGQEAEIAANTSVPIGIFRSRDVVVSRMLRGIAGRVIGEMEFNDDSDLAQKASDFFRSQKSRLRLSRRSREREYNLRLGNRVRDARTSTNLTEQELAEQSGVNKEMIEALESRPERQSGVSLLNLRRIAMALGMSPAELLRDQGGKDQLLEDLYRESITKLREYASKHHLPYEVYAQLKEKGKQVLRDQVYATAARGEAVRSLDSQFWVTAYREMLEG
jgi:transcriptional regulator with XRE-family HTH domain